VHQISARASTRQRATSEGAPGAMVQGRLGACRSYSKSSCKHVSLAKTIAMGKKGCLPCAPSSST
jgi:hypothetical protein